MSTITKERIEQYANDPRMCNVNDEIRQIALIALASLEAEAVAHVVAWSSPNEERTCDVRLRRHDINAGPLYTAPPAPVSVPDEDLLHMAASAIEDLLSSKDRSGAGVWADIPAKLRRAAMLQGADGNSQVMNDYPETLPCPVSLEPGLKLGKGVATKILLEALQSRANYSAEIEVIKEVCRDIKDGDFLAAAKINSSSELVTTAYKLPKPIKDHRLNSGPDADDYYAGYQAGWNDSIGEAVICNSPVIPDGWVACSEQMPEQFKAILAFNEYGEVWSGAYDRYWNFYCDNLLVEHVTHWMPLPAAPQQEA
ncbi:DUF551 domain-containing protein [Enterobacter kobei]|uniref:DUF551 domain-containing protein n=1 Tax=Enterobacter kobei TaxID=208224 RepID=UPI00207C449A|nr:DUF551 domain-containing protein [Enterobacter kobei]MCO4127154.1 DUF551 domain-containing protein [Enterobacter kobei]MCO4184116.1 DUF551 domain-containing protein [Enterobacter kobei]